MIEDQQQLTEEQIQEHKQQWLAKVDQKALPCNTPKYDFDLYDFKQKLRREIDALSNPEVILIEKILVNINENWEDFKYRKIASRKVSEKVGDFLLTLGFKKNVIDFETKFYYDKMENDFKFQETIAIVKSQLEIITKRKQEKLDEREKYKKDQEYKSGLLNIIKQEMISRAK